MRRHKWHAVPGMGGSRMRGLGPWSVSVPHTRGGLGGLACTAAGLRGTDPATDAGGRACARSLRHWVRDAPRGPRIRACRSTLLLQSPSGRVPQACYPVFMNQSSISLK